MITVITYISFFLNIIPVILYLNKLWKQWTIKKILGSKKLDKMILTFPTFGIHCKDISNMPAEAKAQRCFFHIPSKTRQYEAYGFIVCPTTSLAEVRSISYLNSMLNIISITPEIESDASDKIDTNYSDNMISLGFDCYMTIENLKDNPFIDHKKYEE